MRQLTRHARESMPARGLVPDGQLHESLLPEGGQRLEKQQEQEQTAGAAVAATRLFTGHGGEHVDPTAEDVGTASASAAYKWGGYTPTMAPPTMAGRIKLEPRRG